jgi:hypothetical protein
MTGRLSTVLLVVTCGFVSACGEDGGQEPETERPIHYTFDHGTDGWELNANGGAGFTNLGAGVPDGESPPSVSFAEGDGDPSAGSLRLTVSFTAPFQYVAAGVVFGEARDLSSKTLHARVRLVSGSAAGVWVGFYACGYRHPETVDLGIICADLETGLDAAELTVGTWASLASEVVARAPTIGPPTPGDFFGPANVVELGIEVWTNGGDAGGGGFASSRDLVFEIDTVTD